MEKYKLKHRLPPISRLLHYKRLPPPMIGDPKGYWQNWDHRCNAVYKAMMAEKHGACPPYKQKGLWFYAE